MATLSTAASLNGGHKVDQDARSEIVDAAEREGRDLPLEDEKAVVRSVLKKPILPKQPALTNLQVKQKAKEAADAAANKKKNSEVRRTLKGIKYETEDGEEAAMPAPQSLRLKVQDPAANGDEEQPSDPFPEQEHEVEHEEEQQEEQQHEEQQEEQEQQHNPDSWLHPGAHAEWNPFIGKKAKHLLAERDWLLVNIIDKEVDQHGKVRYGIKKGGLRTMVAREQLRKPMKHLQEADRKRNDDKFWQAHQAHHKPTEPPNDDHEDVMVPMHAKVGSTCDAKATKMKGASKYKDRDNGLNDGIDAEECRMLCESDHTCKFAAHGLFKLDGDTNHEVHCVKFETCDSSTGKGFRTWVKARLDMFAAQKARNAEKLEDEYMLKIIEAENVAEQAMEHESELNITAVTKTNQENVEAELKEKKVIKATEPITADDKKIAIQAEVSKVSDGQEAQNQAEAPLWRILLEGAAVVMIMVMFLQSINGMKNRRAGNAASPPDTKSGNEETDANAFVKLPVWIQRESKGIAMLMQNGLNGSAKKQDPDDMEMAPAGKNPAKIPAIREDSSSKQHDSSPEQVEPKKNNARSFGVAWEDVPLEDPKPKEDVSGDAPVNRAALRAAFAASNKARSAA